MRIGEDVSMSGESDTGPPRRDLVGTFLMLPIGLIIVLVLFYFTFRGSHFPGEFLLICVAIFVCLFMIRSLYWRSRRKYWRDRISRNEPIRILRLRYARGEITKEEFDQMLHDLQRKT